MSESISALMKIFKAMDESEQTEAIKRIGAEIGESGLLAKIEAASPKKTGGGGAKKRKSLPYWIRTVQGVDRTANGVSQLEGTWIKKEDIRSGTDGSLFVVGLRHPNKHYGLMKMKAGSTCAIESESGFEMMIEDAELVKQTGSFKKIIDEAEKRVSS